MKMIIILVLIILTSCYDNESNSEKEILLNGFPIFEKINNIDSLIVAIGAPDSIIYDKSLNDEYGYDIYELIYGESTIIVTDSFISDFWILDKTLNLNNVTIGSLKEEVNSICLACSDSLKLNFSNPESVLSFELDSTKKISKIVFSVLIY